MLQIGRGSNHIAAFIFYSFFLFSGLVALLWWIMELLLSRTFAPGSESSTYRTFVPGSKNVLELLLTGAKKSLNFRAQSETEW